MLQVECAALQAGHAEGDKHAPHHMRLFQWPSAAAGCSCAQTHRTASQPWPVCWTSSTWTGQTHLSLLLREPLKLNTRWSMWTDSQAESIPLTSVPHCPIGWPAGRSKPRRNSNFLLEFFDDITEGARTGPRQRRSLEVSHCEAGRTSVTPHKHSLPGASPKGTAASLPSVGQSFFLSLQLTNTCRSQCTDSTLAQRTHTPTNACCRCVHGVCCRQDVPEFTNLSLKAWEAAGALQGLWADAWDALDSASDSWAAQFSNIKQDLAEGKKDVATVVDEVREREGGRRGKPEGREGESLQQGSNTGSVAETSSHNSVAVAAAALVSDLNAQEQQACKLLAPQQSASPAS